MASPRRIFPPLIGLMGAMVLTSSLYAASRDNNVEWDGVYSDTTDNFVSPSEFDDGDTITISLRTLGGDLTAAYCRLYFSGVGEEQFLDMTLSATSATFDRWSVTLQVPAGTTQVWYRFSLEDGSDQDWYDAGDASDNWQVRGMSDVLRENRDFMLVAGFSTPTWSKGAVFYQIFPDRFFDGDSSNNQLYPDDCFWYLDYAPICADASCAEFAAECAQYNVPEASPGYAKNCEFHEVWEDAPNGSACDFFGGDLNGVRAKLDYLEALNIGAIYLNPFFRSQSNHKYDIMDYEKVDPRFGGMDGLNSLTQAASAASIRVVGDGVFNHESDLGKHYNGWGNYSFDSATAQVDGFDFAPTTCGAWEEAFLNPMAANWDDCTSTYRDWFKVWIGTDIYDVDRDGNYDEPAAHTCGWYGFEFMPDIDYKTPSDPNSEARVWLYGGTSAGNPLAAADSIAGKWLDGNNLLSVGLDGWRLDVPDNAGYFNNDYDGDCSKSDNDASIWKGFRTAVKTIGDDNLVIGEIWDDPANRVPNWASNNTFDGVMNYYYFGMPISCLLTGTGVHNDTGECTGDYGAMTLGSATAMEALDDHLANQRRLHPASFYLSSQNLLSSHDTARFFSRAGGSYDKVEEAVVLQATLPGAPMIYYGDEVGVAGENNEQGRATYPWDSVGSNPQAQALLEFTQSLMCIRRSYPALQTGSFITLWVKNSDATYGFGRFDDQDTIAVAINNSGSEKVVSLGVYRLDVSDGTVLIDVMTDDAYTVAGGTISVSVPAWSGMVLVPADRANLGQQCASSVVDTNLPPVADAGADQAICDIETAILDGSGSYDPEGRPLTYVWTDESGTVIGNSASVTVAGTVEGVDTYTLTVSDGQLTDGDTVNVTVTVCCEDGCGGCREDSPGGPRYGFFLPFLLAGLLVATRSVRRSRQD